MEFLNEYLVEEALIIIPVLLILGKIIKETPQIKDWLIPYILLGIGVLLSILLLGINADAVIQGVLVAGASVFGHELYTQARDKE